MRISPCDNPKRIVNPYNNEVLYVPCRKCPTCLNTYQLSWQQRLIEESRNHKYTFFITLTYDENHVPYYKHLENSRHTALDVLVSNRCASPLHIKGDSLRYFNSRQFLPYLCKKDIQLFIKRLRRYSDYYINQNYDKYKKTYRQSSKIRYFIGGEYGPSTLRPHYHMLLWFDNDEIAKNFQFLLSKSWQNGFTSWSIANERRVQYCAKYISCAPYLPSIYENEPFRPFFLCSKKPAIGTYGLKLEALQKLHFESVSKRTLFNGKKYVDVPLQRSLEDRLFPKFKGFNELTHIGRVELLRNCLKISKSTIDKITENGKRCYLFEERVYPDIQNKRFKDSSSVICYSKENLLQLNRLAQRIYFDCKNIYHCSFDSFITNIEIYYNKKKLEQLKNQYEFQSDYIKLHPDELLQLLNMYPDYRDTILTCSKNQLKTADSYILSTFGITKSKCFNRALLSRYLSRIRNTIVLEACSDFNSMRSLHNKIIHDSMKTKHIRDYDSKKTLISLSKNPYKGYY